MDDWEKSNRIYKFDEIMKDGQSWMNQTIRSVSAHCVNAVSHHSFLKCRDLTKEHLAKSLNEALHIVNRQQQYISYLERQTQRLKSDVITHQGSVVDLQRELLAAKDQQLHDLKTSVVSSVENTVKAELQSYSDIVQKSSKTVAGPLIDQNTLKKVVKDVVTEEDRSRNFMIFGLAEEKNEQINERVSNVLLELGEKPKIEASRLGQESTVKVEKKLARPIKVSVSSPAIVQQILSKARKLRSSTQHSQVFLAPDRSAEQRAEQKGLVLELKRKSNEEPDMRHFIKDGKVHSVVKKPNN